MTSSSWQAPNRSVICIFFSVTFPEVVGTKKEKAKIKKKSFISSKACKKLGDFDGNMTSWRREIEDWSIHERRRRRHSWAWYAKNKVRKAFGKNLTKKKGNYPKREPTEDLYKKKKLKFYIKKKNPKKIWYLH